MFSLTAYRCNIVKGRTVQCRSHPSEYISVKPIIPVLKHGELQLSKMNDMTLKCLLDCALVLHQTRNMEFRQAAHIMLDTVLDVEYEVKNEVVEAKIVAHQSVENVGKM